MASDKSFNPALLALRLKAARKRAGITQRELAERSGVSMVTIARMEIMWNPGPQGPLLGTIMALGQALETDLISEQR